MNAPPVKKIGRYAILEILGQGAMGTVYKALDPLIERTVAIKTVPIARLKEEGSEFEARFLREAQSAGRLSHPNIVTIYDVGETDEIAYIAMEYLSGMTLRDIMDHGPMPLDLALATTLQIAEALAYAHEHGVIHRDIKPSNVVVANQRGQVKLTDFGIAHLVNSDKTHPGLMFGSPRYMSPEQAMGREISGSSDIFSLGALLYEMLTGEYAFTGDNLPGILYRVINEAPPAPAQSRPEISPVLERIVMRTLSKRAEARPEIRVLIQELQLVVPTVATYRRIETDNRVHWLLPGVAFLTPLSVFLILGLGIAIIRHFVPTPPEQRHTATAPISRSVQVPTLTPPTPAPKVPSGLQNPTQHPPRRTTIPSSRLGRQAPAKASSQNTRDAYLQSLEAKEVELQIRKTELLLQFTEAHPDVVLIERQLEQLREARRRHLRATMKH